MSQPPKKAKVEGSPPTESHLRGAEGSSSPKTSNVSERLLTRTFEEQEKQWGLFLEESRQIYAQYIGAAARNANEDLNESFCHSLSENYGVLVTPTTFQGVMSAETNTEKIQINDEPYVIQRFKNGCVHTTTLTFP